MRICDKQRDTEVRGKGKGMVQVSEVPLQPMEVHSGAEIHQQFAEDPILEQMDAQKRL